MTPDPITVYLLWPALIFTPSEGIVFNFTSVYVLQIHFDKELSHILLFEPILRIVHCVGGLGEYICIDYLFDTMPDSLLFTNKRQCLQGVFIFTIN